MAIRRALVMLKRSAWDVYTNLQRDPQIMSLVQANHPVVGNLVDRHKTHVETVKFCEDILHRKPLEWRTVVGDELEAPISDIDLVITIGGDGTILQASHFVDNSASIFGVNSDPSRITEIKENSESFDARRSTGYMCAATAESFEEVLDEILEGRRKPVQLSRILTCIDGVQSHTLALNDVLLAHPCPAAVTNCSFRILKGDSYDSRFHPVYSRSSGLRVCTAAGSTAAMHSAGGCLMPILSKDLQYMVREPILPPDHSRDLDGWIRTDEVMHIVWGCTEGYIYIDGCHVSLPLKFGNTVQISSRCPPLQVYMHPSRLQHVTN